MMMNRITYKKCFVPECTNSTITKPDKVFVNVKDCLKKKWCRQVNIPYVPTRRLYCCDDHLDLKEDLENYFYWKMMKGKPSLKSTAKLRNTSKDNTLLATRQIMQNVTNLPTIMENTNIDENMETSETQDLQCAESSVLKILLLQPCENLPNSNQNIINKPTETSTSTHPVQINAATQCDPVILLDKGTYMRKPLPNDVLSLKYEEVWPESSTATSLTPSLYGCTSETDTSTVITKEIKYIARQQILEFINGNPKMYIGLPKQYLWLVGHIVKQSQNKTIKEIDIILTLFKIKQNDSFLRMSEQFQLSRTTLTKSFLIGIETLAIFFQNLIFMPTKAQIKRNLPLVFKIRYSNVQCILDAFEIEIQKPSNPLQQAQTWSQYKHCNTVKYLIGCTPNGFVCYISKGFGGRISDKALVENSDLIETLPSNAVIMADRGFKEVEALLMTKGITLLRPPSVYASAKPTKEEVLQTKVIASLRIHIERVIRRVREFRLLKPHSVVSYKHVSYLDEIVLIVCGLINLQNEIIKHD